jgi:hypothetical protein
MKRKMSILILLLPFFVQAQNSSDAIPELLGKMVNSENDNYIAARDNVVEMGEDILPLLKKVAMDTSRGWRERLAARICFERIVYGDRIMEFRNFDWTGLYNKSSANKNTSPSEEKYVTSLESESEAKKSRLNSESFQNMVKPISDEELDEIQELIDKGGLLKPTKKLVLVGIRAPITAGTKYSHLKDDFFKHGHKLDCWYYFIELTWKNTGETAINCELGESFDKQWVEWCRDIVRGQPEEIWLCRATADHLATAEFSDWREQKLYASSLSECGCPELIPVLCARYEDFYKAIISGSDLETEMGKNPKRYLTEIEKLIKKADKRHVESLRKLINRHPPLEPLRPKLQELEKRSPVANNPR